MYPSRKVIVEGTKTIKAYLKDQYELENRQNVQKLSSEAIEDDEEELVNIVDVNNGARNLRDTRIVTGRNSNNDF